MSDLAERLDAWLPQTQCTRCGYPRCRAYAEALARGEADIDQCPPGGEATVRALAEILGVPPKPLNPVYAPHEPRRRAQIDEALCIGCAKCLDACPVDAIVGSHKLMHTVIAAECSGCGLCVPPCPVDCIALAPSLTGHAQSASGSPQSEPNRASARSARSPLPAGEGMGVRADSPHPLPSPGGRGEVCENLYFGRNEGEGARSGGPWPEYALAETARWRERTERHFQRLARRARADRSSAGVSSKEAERRRIRAEIRAAVERVKARRGGP